MQNSFINTPVNEYENTVAQDPIDSVFSSTFASILATPSSSVEYLSSASNPLHSASTIFGSPISIPHATQDAQERFDEPTDKAIDAISTPTEACALVLVLPRRMTIASLLCPNTSLHKIGNTMRLRNSDMKSNDINFQQFNCSQQQMSSPDSLTATIQYRYLFEKLNSYSGTSWLQNLYLISIDNDYSVILMPEMQLKLGIRKNMYLRMTVRCSA
uniref:Uncharacterized protein n=1 Tax=Glossina austeni TaxID=7395 RepID=A0A1A9V2F9_GLOAU